jgi:hypothetical protein
LPEADEGAWQKLALAGENASVPETAAFSVLATGEASGRVAEDFGLSVGRVSRLRRVRAPPGNASRENWRRECPS